MKKIFLLASLFTTLLFADGTNEPCTPSTMEYQVYGELLILQPNGSNLIYAMQADPKNPALANPLVEANWFSHEINPTYHPAFEIGAKFVFKEMQMNLAIDWERFSGSDRSHKSVPNGEAMLGPLFDIGPDAEIYINAKGKVDFRFDEVDLTLEKQLYSSHGWTIDLCAGGSFVRIREKKVNKYFDDERTTARVIRSPSTFIGGGALFGFNFDYEIVKNFSLIGNSSLALYVGQLKNRTSHQSFSPALATMNVPQPNTEKTHVKNRTQMVPGLKEKLAFAGNIPFDCANLLIEAGYLFQIYLNAIQSLDMTVIVNANDLPFPSTVGYYAQAFERTLSNFMLSGPYLKIQLSF